MSMPLLCEPAIRTVRLSLDPRIQMNDAPFKICSCSKSYNIGKLIYLIGNIYDYTTFVMYYAESRYTVKTN